MVSAGLSYSTPHRIYRAPASPVTGGRVCGRAGWLVHTRIKERRAPCSIYLEYVRVEASSTCIYSSRFGSYGVSGSRVRRRASPRVVHAYTRPRHATEAPAPLPSLQFTHAYFMVWIFLGDWPDRIRLTVTRHFFSIFFSRKAETRFMRGAAAYMGWLARLTSRGTVRLSVVYLSPNGT